MKTGLDAKRIFFNHSGLGNYGRRFYRALATKLTEEEFFLYSPREVPSGNPYLGEIVGRNSRIVHPSGFFGSKMGGSIWRSAILADQLEKDRIDIYYGLSNEVPFGIHQKRMVRVVIIHDLIFIRYPKLYPATDVFFYRKKTAYACRNCDLIITASEQTKNDIINFYGINARKIHVIYPASDPQFYTGEPPDSSEFFDPRRKYILSIGAITPRKNLMKTVEAFHTVCERLNYDLAVIGTAVGLGRKYLKTIKEYIEKNSLGDRIHFLGNVPYGFVPDICRKAEMMVYPSQFEGFGMPIVEGLLSRIPVITSGGGCFPEAGGDAAVYIDPENPGEIADWITRLAGDRELRDELIRKGEKHAERFTQERISADILEFHLSATGHSFRNS